MPLDIKTIDHLRKTRRLVDQLAYELDEENYNTKHSPSYIHSLAWEIVTATRPEEEEK
tara:strand:+ start:2228 stop:2401 length:174 start_codon:yes stop_codon:yes gene_type:complete